MNKLTKFIKDGSVLFPHHLFRLLYLQLISYSPSIQQPRREINCEVGYQKQDPYFVENHFLCDMCPGYTQSNDPFMEWPSGGKSLSRPLSLSNTLNASGYIDEFKRSHPRTSMSCLTQTFKSTSTNSFANSLSLNEIMDPVTSSLNSIDNDHMRMCSVTRAMQ